MGYIAAGSLEEALAALSTPDISVIAGGTDWYPALGERAVPEDILDISRIESLRGISETGTGWRIGAGTRWSDLYAAGLPPAFDGLIGAAREVGSIQIQNAGTIAGNLCNASPAADGVPPLLTLEAEIEVSSQAGTRVLPLEDFIKGPRNTDLALGEMVTAILIPKIEADASASFIKLGTRKYLVISIAMVAVLLRKDAAGCISHARISVGACSAVAQRMRRLEAALIGTDIAKLETLDKALLDGLAPIDDVRGSVAYRNDAVAELILRGLRAA